MSAGMQRRLDAPAAPRPLRLQGAPGERKRERNAGPPPHAQIRVATAAPRRHRRRPARRQPRVVAVVASLAALGFGVTIALGVTGPRKRRSPPEW